jgi:single-strand DNA-binding protein
MLNKAQIIGRAGKDPEVRFLPSGEAVASFSLATTEKWKDKSSGEAREETEWHRISAFGRLAEIIGEYVRKGSLIYVEGKIKTRKFTDKDGVEKYSTEIRINEMKLLSKPEGQEPVRPAAPAKSGFDDMDDDIPF